jgi:Fe2+ or Zn2+ uptake regulation protein
LRCGLVIEFAAPQVWETAASLCQEQGLQVVQLNLLLSGYCAACNAERSKKAVHAET